MKFPGLFIKAVSPVASLALGATAIIQLRSQIWTSGAICLVLALAGLAFSLRLLEKNPFTPEEIESLRPVLAPAFHWMAIVGLITISVIYVADTVLTPETDRVAAGAWVCGVMLSLIVVWWRSIRSLFVNGRALLIEKIRTNRTELFFLSLVIGMAFLVRTINLSTHPYPWSGDEASVGSEARRILKGDITNFFDTGWSSQPNWSFVPVAITETVFGQNVMAVRAASALAGVLAVLFVYLTARVLFNPAIGLMAGTVLATLPYNVHFSRVGVNNVMDSLMSSLLFWLIAKALRDDDRRFYYSAGVVTGLSFYTYAGTRIVIILGMIIFIFSIIRQRGYLPQHWKHLLAYLFGIALSMAPQATFFIRHPDIFLGRLGQEGILFNGWLTQRALQTGQSVMEILFNQFTRTTMVFIASPAPGNFLNSPDPYLTLFGSVLFLFGMGYSLAYLFDTKYFIILIWFWAVILFGGILTLNPPANTRMLMTSPPVAIFMALGSYKIIEYLQRFRIVPERAVFPILIAAVSIISYQNINFYMIEYKNNMYFQDANGEYAMETGLMAKDLGKGYLIYIVGSPRIFAGFPTLSFLAPNNQHVDLNADTLATLTLSPDRKVAFFAIPENRPLLQEISQKFPGGKKGLVFRKPKPDEVLFEYYILSP